MRNLMVTGGAGFIGSNFVRYMLDKYPDYRILVYDKLTYAGNLDNLLDVDDDPRYSFVKGDICDADAVAQAIKTHQIDTIVNFAAESVVADTFIPVHYGHGIRLMTAEELFAAYAVKRGTTTDARGTEIVEPDLPLFALAFRNGMGQWRRIICITRHHYQGKVVSLRQKWGHITVTPNHSVYDADAQLVAAATNPELLAVRKINVDRSRHRDYLDIHLPGIKSTGDLLYAPTADGRTRSRDVYVRQSPQGDVLLALMRFLGAYVAEGNALFNKANGGWQICIANNDLEFLRQLRRDAEPFTNTAGAITERAYPNSHQLTFSSHILYLLVTHLCGAHASEKQVPDVIYTLSDEYKQAFLESYLRGDGNIQHYKTVESRRLTTVSPKLAAGMGLLLSLMNLDYSVGFRDFADHENWHAAYSLHIVSNYDTRAERGFEEHDYDGLVYDLTVEGAHNFAAGIGNIVVHNTHVDRSIMDPDAFIKTDVYGTYVLLEAARQFKLERVHQIGTDEVYGHVEGTHRSLETDPVAPRSPYAASKTSADLMTIAYHVTYGLPVTITRGANNIGPYQYPEKVVPLFVTNAIDGQSLPVYGDGRQRRDYQFVLDHCEGIDVVLHRGKLGEIYNVGTGSEMENLAMVEILLDELGKPASLIRHVEDRPGHDRRYCLNVDKLKALGWQPRHTHEEAIRRTVRWYVANEWWWRKIKSGEFKEYYRRLYGDRQALDTSTMNRSGWQ
jgi:dTDP-glucose 4,6-dehydratase